MMISAILFYLFAILTVGAAVLMVISKNIVHSAFALMFSLLGVAALFVLLNADFVAATQLMVYVGGILVLILFGVMLTTQQFTIGLKTITVNIIPASILSATAGGLLLYLFFVSEWNVIEPVERNETVMDLGNLLLRDYILPFQVAGVLLLVAIIGALLMTTRDKDEDFHESGLKK
ncbi:MAG: NADH-quinone oxidoreductase subunit J [Balneolaceae bacterium]